jgi:hypothetical protein
LRHRRDAPGLAERAFVPAAPNRGDRHPVTGRGASLPPRDPIGPPSQPIALGSRPGLLS